MRTPQGAHRGAARHQHEDALQPVEGVPAMRGMRLHRRVRAAA
jgi:hypothetical protein